MPEDADAAALGAELLHVVARVNRLATARTPMPLPPAQARLLATVEDRGSARISELAALDHCSQPTMTAQVRRLGDAGLVERAGDPLDGRAVRVAITEAGRAHLAKVRGGRARAVAPWVATLDATQRRILADAVALLRAFVEADGASPPGTPPETGTGEHIDADTEEQ